MNSSDSSQISPIKRLGVTIHFVSVVTIVGLIFFLLVQLNKLEIGPLFVFLLLLLVLSFLFLLFFGYRLLSVVQSKYLITREGIFLKWGFREQLISMNDVLWIQIEEDLTSPLVYPLLSWMGSNQGTSVHNDLGEVEFMFSSLQNITLIGTKDKVFVVSPKNQNLFLQQFQRAIEFGSLDKSPGSATYPNFLLVEIWKLIPAKYFLFPAITFSISLFVWVGFAIPNYSQVSLGFSSTGTPLASVPGIQLILLPSINFFLLILNVWVATYFYKRDQNHPVISFLFVTSAFTGIVFLVALFQILNIS